MVVVVEALDWGLSSFHTLYMLTKIYQQGLDYEDCSRLLILEKKISPKYLIDLSEKKIPSLTKTHPVY